MSGKGQISLEIMVVISILLIGVVIFGVYFLNQQNSFQSKVLINEELEIQSPIPYEEIVTNPLARCGDGICDSSEDCLRCPDDCLVCAPTCSDGVLNQDEQRIDCGGSCPPCNCETLGQVTFTPPSTTFLISGDVLLSYYDPHCSDFNITYTVDGTTPDENSSQYTNPITVAFPETAKTITANVFAYNLDGDLVTGTPRAETYTIRLPYCYQGVSRGNGTPESPKEICDAAGLDAVDDHLSWWYVIGADINLDIPPYNSGNGWPPIGYLGSTVHPQYNTFTGNLDGNGHTIYNLYMQTPDSWDYHGLFSSIGPGAVIRNLNLRNVSMLGIQTNSGTLVGIINGGTVDNCSATGFIDGHKDYLGGLVGSVTSGTITNSFAAVNVISNKWYVGGLVGAATNSNLTNNYSFGNISGGQKYVGGLVGKTTNTNTINNYSKGTVSGGNNIGCFVGDSTGGTTTSSYYDRTVCTIAHASNNNFGALGKLTPEMRITNTYVDWNFTNIWNRDDTNTINLGYPYLRNNLP